MHADCSRKTITQPDVYWQAFEVAAGQAGMSLSAWIGEQGKAALPAAVRRRLPARPGAHRPKRPPAE